MSSLPLEADLLCRHCSQNLRQVASDRCPECGHRFDRAQLVTSAIPWEHRRQIGRFRAYWRTARLVTFHGARFTAGEQITLRAARAFRRWTLLLACLAALAPVILWKMNDNGIGSSAQFERMAPLSWKALPYLIHNPWFFNTSAVALCVWIIAATEIPAWFFQSRRLTGPAEQRALALHGYAVAPLAWMPVFGFFALLFLGVEVSYERHPYVFYPAAGIFGTLLVVCGMCPVAYAWTIVRSIRIAAGSRRRGTAATFLLPVLWMLLAAFIFIVLQFAVSYLALFFACLRH